STRFGAVPLVTLGWIGWNSFVFGNYPDMLPFLPFVAFFVGWLWHVAHDVLIGSLARRWPARQRVASVAFHLPLLFALSAYGLWDERAPAQGLTLAQQETLVHRIVESAGSDGELVALSAEAVYVLGERRSPNRFLRIADAWGSYLHLVGLPSCGAAHDDMLSRQPAVVVLRISPRSHACQKKLAPALRRRGYTEETISVRPRTLWHVYRRRK
ncbi:MAG: hypothetical protein O7G30_07335, partial [Proteobacteria bacterium]|nr:hypothetical protein [Pseudomonadota bacterium]